MAIAYLSSFLIYMFIFMYGSMVIRGVIEEKTNRIVEVIISSVKPVELMLGKIIGVAFVALLQFLLWIVLTAIIFLIVMAAIGSGTIAEMGQVALRCKEAFPAPLRHWIQETVCLRALLIRCHNYK